MPFLLFNFYSSPLFIYHIFFIYKIFIKNYFLNVETLNCLTKLNVILYPDWQTQLRDEYLVT